MEFTNYTRHDTTSRTTIKSIKTKFKNKEFKGIGSYIEAEVLKKGHKSVIKIPFFNTYKNNFIDVDSTNYLNKKAKKVVRKVIKKNTPDFDFVNCVTNALNNVNKQISELGITGEEIKKKLKLENYRDKVLNNAKEKDSERIAKNEIAYLSEFINKGLNLENCKTSKEKTEKVKNYLDQYEYLETLKAQVKKFTWSKKKGLAKLNNKANKRIGAVLLAALLGLGAYKFTNIKDIFKSNDDETIENNSQKIVTSKEVSDSAEENAKNEEKDDLEETAKEVVNPAEEIQATEEVKTIEEAYQFNLNAFNSNLNTINSRNYEYSFEQAVYGYTFIEHVNEFDSRSINSNEMQDYLNASRTLISILIEKGEYNKMSLEGNTINVIKNCLNGDIETAIEFVRNAKENNVALLDMLAVGEEVSYLLNGDTLHNFNTQIYFKEINEYFNSLVKGKEVNKVLKLHI